MQKELTEIFVMEFLEMDLGTKIIYVKK